MYTKVILYHASSEQDPMVTGVSAGSGSQGSPVCDGAEVNFFRYNTLFSLCSEHKTSENLQRLKLFECNLTDL